MVDAAKVLAATLTPPPKNLGVTHSSSRLLAPHVGLDYGQVAKVWRDYGIRPWKAETFKCCALGSVETLLPGFGLC